MDNQQNEIRKDARRLNEFAPDSEQFRQLEAHSNSGPRRCARARQTNTELLNRGSSLTSRTVSEGKAPAVITGRTSGRPARAVTCPSYWLIDLTQPTDGAVGDKT